MDENHFEETFGQEAYDGQTITGEREGFTFIATIHADDDSTPPWKREDGHGPVTDWQSRDKGPGELVLNSDRTSKRFYDFAEACRIARRDGWGCAGGQLPGESKRTYAARAAMADYERLRHWCADDWSYVGVAVTVEKDGVRLTGPYDHAIWGVESDCGDYLTELANEYLEEALEAARAKLASLCDCGEHAQ